MNDILTPSFSDWLFGLLVNAAKWINMFDEAADRGDNHDADDKDDDDDDAGDDDSGGDDDGNKDDKDDKDDEDADDKEGKKDGEDDGDKGDDDDSKEDKSHLIARHRYDSAAARANTAEGENDRLREENASLRGKADKSDDTPTLEDKISDLDTKIEEARADNKVDDVVRLSKEQRGLERELYTEIATDTSTAAGQQAREQIKFDDVVDHLEEIHPQLNKDDKDFDQELVNDILAMQAGLVEAGRSPAAAMTRAADALIPKVIDGKSIDKKKTDVKKNLDAANKQAPDNKDKGENSDKGGDLTNPEQLDAMTQSEFDAIPEETLKRLRGDTF
jgi:hypothetical protein